MCGIDGGKKGGGVRLGAVANQSRRRSGHVRTNGKEREPGADRRRERMHESGGWRYVLVETRSTLLEEALKSMLWQNPTMKHEGKRKRMPKR